MAKARKISASKATGDLSVTDRLAAGDRQGGRLNPAIGSGLFPGMVASPDVRMSAQIGSWSPRHVVITGIPRRGDIRARIQYLMSIMMFCKGDV
jgi:hypothetical protein